jgi:VIT1/CCC1 family predicted Fe2+/Mn2+ transporter
MNTQFRKGFGFGLTSGVITTLGLIVGLDASTGSRFAVIAGIIAIAIADACSDALGMHISEESTYKRTTAQIWEATLSTFFFKFAFALTFVIPFLLLSLQTALIICIIWGLFLITTYSYYLAKKTKVAPHKVILEHVLIMVLVIVVTYFVGKATAVLFGF